jgi:hypothetical protein
MPHLPAMIAGFQSNECVEHNIETTGKVNAIALEIFDLLDSYCQICLIMRQINTFIDNRFSPFLFFFWIWLNLVDKRQLCDSLPASARQQSDTPSKSRGVP